MKAKNFKIITVAGITLVVAVVSIYANKVSRAQNNWQYANSQTIENMGLQDTAEIEGVLTNDDPWKQIENIVIAYYSKSGVEYKGFIKVIDDNLEQEKVIEEQDFEYTLLDIDTYQYRIGSTEIINKPRFLLAADHTNKTISMVRKAVSSRPGIFDIEMFKKYLDETKADAKVSVLGDEKVITVDNIQDPNIQGYRIYYSPNTYRVHKMLIGMLRLSPLEDVNEDNNEQTPKSGGNENAENNSLNEQGIKEFSYYLEVAFQSIKILNVDKKNFNPERKYITISGGAINLAEGAKGYRLLNTVPL